MTTAQVALAAIGVIVWGWGTKSGDPRVGWVGIALLGAASLLRVIKRRRPPAD